MKPRPLIATWSIPFAPIMERAVIPQEQDIEAASGSSRPSILPLMVCFGIEVDALASSEDLTRGIPYPDLFLKAAESIRLFKRGEGVDLFS